ncbi:Hpt domain-containing protein [Pseudarthrobacter raffinosi]|uniref:Hpt domain-containing protein n=1 Tax=Pseudarthrobacter raffinosi TaxID=2953651 RepID=UPI00208EFF98|nr:Hpt domain-containing protein [Pseudarthrobacter sp. MDT3-9]MCO4250430.1 Hpt domain-containing protein [Pseudarthrobacter sp. MDT3-9]
MVQDDADAVPLLDPAVLDRLRTELEDDDGVWKVFVQNFIEHLPHRTEKLRLTLTTGDLAGAMDAVLSLKTSSQMVGAERLAGLAMELERALRHEGIDNEPARVLPRLAADRLRQIIRCARQTTNILQKYLHSG